MTITPKRWGNPLTDSGNLEADELTDLEVRMGAYADTRGPSGNIDVTSYGAVADNSTDSSVAIQAAIDASSVGNTIWFPGQFRAKDLRLKSDRTYRGIHAGRGGSNGASIISLPNGATTASYIAADESYVNNTSAPSFCIRVLDLWFGGNRTNIASGTQRGLILRCWRPEITGCTFADCRDEGLRITPYSANNTAANGQISEPLIDSNVFANNVGGAMHVVHNAGGGTAVDGIFTRNNVSGVTTSNTVNQVLIEAGGGWKVGPNNHFWLSGATHMSLQNGYGSSVIGNIYETPAETQTTGTHWCIDLGVTNNHPVVVANNVAYQDFVTAAVRGFLYIGNSGALSPLVVVSGNNYLSGTTTDIFCHPQGDNGGTINATLTGNHVSGATKYVDTSGSTVVNQQGNSWQYGSGAASPASGTYIAGTQWWRRDPSASTSPGAICTAGGTPGTWKTMAALGA